MKRFIAIDTFGGCGGSTKGLIDAGFEVILAVDQWEEALRVHHTNFPFVPSLRLTLGGDLKATARALLKFLPDDRESFHFHLHGSPPCQKLSTASNHNTRSGYVLVEWFIELVRLMKPDSWSMENVLPVKKFLESDGIPFQQINAADYGVPQARKRIFAGEGWEIKPTVNDHVGVIDALPHLIDLPKPNHIVSRRRGKNHPNFESTPSQAYAIETPSHTITRLPHVVEVECEKVRSLTVEESATLQGFPMIKFPDDVRFKDRWIMVGNMVNPPVMEAIARSIMEASE